MARRSKLKVKKKRASRKPSQIATRKLLEALSLSMEPTTFEDHPDGNRAAQDPSQDDLRKILEKLEQWMEPTTVEVKHRPHAVRQNHVSKPCCGGGGRQEEIKDSSNTSRNQSISDDILSGGEAVDSETLGSPRDKIPLNIRWGEWGAPEEDDTDLRLSEVYPDIWGPFIPLRFAGEENWCKDEKYNPRPEDYDCTVGIEFDTMPPIPFPKVTGSFGTGKWRTEKYKNGEPKN